MHAVLPYARTALLIRCIANLPQPVHRIPVSGLPAARQRMPPSSQTLLILPQRVHSVTQAAACVKCHSRMNDLGYPLEQFDDFGRFRTVEPLEHPDNLIRAGKGNYAVVYKTKSIDPTGVLSGTGDPKLDGPVTDAYDLIDRLAKSDRVRQSINRHAFRFFLGRNELPSDSRTLIAADQAYLMSGGSIKAVVVTLLTSDSFIYRK